MSIRMGHAICAVMCLLGHAAMAGDDDVGISSEPKKIADKVTAQRADEESKTQKWGYTVTIENKTFKPLENLEVKYIVYYNHETLGINAPARKEHHAGSYTIAEVDASDKVSFDTEPVELTTAFLVGPVGGYYYFPNGAKPKVEDSMAGIWIRIYQGGSLFAEYANPPELTEKEQWQ